MCAGALRNESINVCCLVTETHDISDRGLTVKMHNNVYTELTNEHALQIAINAIKEVMIV